MTNILFVTIDVECIVLICKWLFVTTVISQGSVATRLRCGGQCDSQFVANFFMNSTMKNFGKSVNICQSYGQKYRGPFFDSQCMYTNLVLKLVLLCLKRPYSRHVLLTVCSRKHKLSRNLKKSNERINMQPRQFYVLDVHYALLPRSDV